MPNINLVYPYIVFVDISRHTSHYYSSAMCDGEWCGQIDLSTANYECDTCFSGSFIQAHLYLLAEHQQEEFEAGLNKDERVIHWHAIRGLTVHEASTWLDCHMKPVV